MRTGRFEALVGANLHAHHGVCRVLVDWTARAPRFVPVAGARPALADLAQLFPGIASPPVDARGLDLAAVLLACTARLLDALGLPPRLQVVSEPAPGIPGGIAFDCIDADLARTVADLALRVLDHLFPGPDGSGAPPHWSPAAAIGALLALPAAHLPRADTLYLMQAAADRDIPVDWLGGQQVLYGHGRRQRRMQRNFTDRTAHLAYLTACDKPAAHAALQRAGLPVPAQVVVGDAPGALRAAQSLGWPVVVKPAGTDTGVGVTVGVTDADALARAFDQAHRQHPAVVVESVIPGHDHRLLVVAGRFVAAVRREPPCVVGDGRQTIAALVDAANRDPHRSRRPGSSLRPLVLDDESRAALAAQGWAPGDRPDPGTRVWLRRVANASRGATTVDVTDAVHPDNRRLAETAAAAIGLDIAGVDYLAPDIARSWREGSGAICEINPTPTLWPHAVPVEGRPRDVATPILDLLFPDGGTGRIPVAAVTGTNGKTTTTRLLARILRGAGDCVGLACSEGTWIDDECVATGDRGGGPAARQLLQDRRIDAAVLEIARGAILKLGCGIETCDVAAVLNVDDDHLGEAGIVTREQMAAAKGLLVEIARTAVVLNAEDPLCVALATRRRGARLLLFALDPGAPAFAAHMAQGGEGATVVAAPAGPTLALCRGAARDLLLPVAAVPATREGRARHNVQNVLAAAALAHGLGISAARIAQVLAGFRSDARDNPGRINPCEGLPFQMLIDRCHNRHGMQRLGEFVRGLPVQGRRLLGISAAGDRRDVDIEALGREAARHFDAVVIYPPPANYLRGRAPETITACLSAGLLAGGRAAGDVHVEASPPAAMDRLLALAAPGDLVVATFADRAMCEARVEAAGGRVCRGG